MWVSGPLFFGQTFWEILLFAFLINTTPVNMKYMLGPSLLGYMTIELRACKLKCDLPALIKLGKQRKVHRP